MIAEPPGTAAQDSPGQAALKSRMALGGPKKLLAIDGGGVRGLLALGILEGIEARLRIESGREDYVLADYFDAIAGTSTGAIIAAGLSLGKTVAELIDFYVQSGPTMFQRAGLRERLRFSYSDARLAGILRSVFGDLTLGSDALRTILMLVMRNASTDSPWPLTNNPYAAYNRLSHGGCNLHLPLWQLIRASTAAPIYFPPEKISVGEHRFLFVDGGVTMYNNPAFKLFLMMTVDQYWRGGVGPVGMPWQPGAERMLLMSVGTGMISQANERLDEKDMSILFNLSKLPSQLISSSAIEQDLLCRVFGTCVAGNPIDREVGNMVDSCGPIAQKLFRYARYNADLTSSGLEALGLKQSRVDQLQRLDCIGAMSDLLDIGRAVSATQLHRDHFDFDRFGAGQ